MILSDFSLSFLSILRILPVSFPPHLLIYRLYQMKFSAALFSVTLLSLNILSADWRTDTGWDTLQLYAGTALPTGSGVAIEMVEANTSYMPDVNYSGFAGINFTNISDTNTGTSGHATSVAKIFFGQTTSLLTGTTTVGVRSANHFNNNFLLANTVGTYNGYYASDPVGTSSAKVVNHSYVGAANASQEVGLNEIIKRFDYFSQDSNVLNVIAMNNGDSGTIPPLFGSAYNSISVGRSDGLHSHGSTPANYHGPGRQKPDIVAPLTVTSSATPAVSSAATLLHAKATLANNTNATHPDTIKACLLSGATKAEFPSWSQTSAKPLDTTFGTGELNVFQSYRILEKSESSPGNVNHRGWDRNSVTTSQTRTYTFTTPSYKSPTLSASLIWQRDVNELRVWDSGNRRFYYYYVYDDLSNLKLELLNQSGTPIQTSDSGLDNVEHIWNTTLTPNTTYSLKVSSSSGSANFSLAWQVNGTGTAEVVSTASGNDIDLTMNGLIANTPYTVRRSTDLNSWLDVHSFTPTGNTFNWTDSSAPSGERVFYRLFFFEP